MNKGSTFKYCQSAMCARLTVFGTHFRDLSECTGGLSDLLRYSVLCAPFNRLESLLRDRSGSVPLWKKAICFAFPYPLLFVNSLKMRISLSRVVVNP